MKKSTLIDLVAYLNGKTLTNLEEIKQELEQELNRNAEKKAANQDLYANAGAVMMKHLDYAPATASELWESCEKEMPSGFSKGKFTYALSRGVWDGVVKVEGNPNRYRKA